MKEVLNYKFDSLKHCKTRLYYHVVLATKYRKPVLEGIEGKVEETFKEIETQGKFKVIEGRVGEGDHVHILLRVRPSASIGWVIFRLKQLSTHKLWEEEKKRLKKYYWKQGKRILWSEGYFAESVGSNIEAVTNYILNQ